MARTAEPTTRRRRPSPSVGLLGVAVLLVGVPALIVRGPSSVGDAPAAITGVDAPIVDAAAGEAGAGEGSADETAATAGPATPVFATIDRLTLHLPAPDVVLVGFHEASSREALAFDPVGELEDHQNTTKFDPPPDEPGGPPYVVLASRGRPFPATSAIDVLVDEGDPVRSPVSGTVTDVRGYLLYGKHADQRIEIAPSDAPGQRIVMIHLDGVTVGVGDEVAAGRSVVAAGARRFPFGSNIDRYTEPDRHPHVHYEVKRDTRGGAGG